MADSIVGICLDNNGAPITWNVTLTGAEVATLADVLRDYAGIRSGRMQSLTPIEAELVKRFIQMDWSLRMQLCESDLGRPCQAS